MATGAKLGMNAGLYVMTGGTWSAPTWTELTNVTNVDSSNALSLADVTTRANNGFRAQVGTLADGDITFEMIAIHGDTDIDLIADAYDDREVLTVMALDAKSDVVGARGLKADMMVTDFSRGEQLEDAVRYNVTLTMTASANAPERIVVTAGS